MALYKELRSIDGSLPNPVQEFLRYADGATVARAATSDFERFLEETEDETINIDPADPLHVLSDSEEWALENQQFLFQINKLIYRDFKAQAAGKNVLNTLLDLTPVFENVNNAVLTAKVVEYKQAAGVPGDTLTSADVNAMTGAQRTLTLNAVRLALPMLGVSGLSGQAQADPDE